MKKTFAVLAGLAVASLFILPGPAHTGGKESHWKTFLPADAYKELVHREVKILQECLKGNPEEKVLDRAKVATVMIAALSLSAGKNVKHTAAVEHAALQLSKQLQGKDKIAEARKMADVLASMKLPSPRGGLREVNMNKVFGGDILAVMDHLRTKMKGGDGMHPDLQTNARLKAPGLNGIEEKIRSLDMKKLTEAAMTKSAAEMVLLGYRTAALAEVTYDFAPENKVGKKDPKVWRELSVQMRDSALDMAEAAKKKDADAVLKAASRLYSSCSQCHSIFK